MTLGGADVLVTGGAGTIGSTIVDRLLATGVNRVDILDNLVRGRRENLEGALADGRVRLIEGDIRDRDLVDSLVRGKDVVFHQAAIRITQCAEDPRLAFDVLAQGSFTVFEAAAAHRVGRVVAASSASIYGLATRFPTHERHHPYANDTIYGAAKAFNEGMLTSFGAMAGLHSTALRYFNVYGPRMDVHGLYTEVLVRWMERIESGVPPLILGDGSQTMDFVHVDDVARANVIAATAGHDGAFNIGAGVETSLLDLARTLLQVMESDLEVEFAPARSVNSVTRRLADTRAARDELGFVADIDLASGLRSLVQWWRGERADAPALSGASR
ncbi:NAD-dependent epimerase/dehydratase family protein [Rathayibacter sp. VKM Ac-2803]|nr:NAD-dependent epimerase/dehydratase family protein [Rathayibacter sp. VKM Ac-2803]MWV57873.1 NAD-dependent epimerase/dehydratase family protein [Rathayibacter sp. VKM Ac-2754]